LVHSTAGLPGGILGNCDGGSAVSRSKSRIISDPDNFAHSQRTLLEQISILSLFTGSFGSPLFRGSSV
jgi:hypothetical protein